MQQVISLILLLLIAPLLLLCVLLIYVSSGYPAFFKQERIGKNLTPFTIYKLRTMKNGKITKSGAILRKTGLDELPQLLNILKGDMAFVGPRPLMQSDIDRLGWNTAQHEKRWSVRPGITGQAQLVNVCDKNVTWENDMHYVDHKSAGLDLKILWRSMLVPIIGKSQAKQILHKSSQ